MAEALKNVANDSLTKPDYLIQQLHALLDASEESNNADRMGMSF